MISGLFLAQSQTIGAIAAEKRGKKTRPSAAGCKMDKVGRWGESQRIEVKRSPEKRRSGRYRRRHQQGRRMRVAFFPPFASVMLFVSRNGSGTHCTESMGREGNSLIDFVSRRFRYRESHAQCTRLVFFPFLPVDRIRILYKVKRLFLSSASSYSAYRHHKRSIISIVTNFIKLDQTLHHLYFCRLPRWNQFKI